MESLVALCGGLVWTGCLLLLLGTLAWSLPDLISGILGQPGFPGTVAPDNADTIELCNTISAVGGEAGQRAKAMVDALVAEPEVGKTYEGPVKSTTPFGAFVEIMPGVEGLLHISELQHGRTEKTEDVVKKGDVVTVKLLEVDERGRMKLSRKALIPKE